MSISLETLALAKKSCEGKTVDANEVVIKACNGYTDTAMGKAKDYAAGQAASAEGNAKSYTNSVAQALVSISDDNAGNVTVTITAPASQNSNLNEIIL